MNRRKLKAKYRKSYRTITNKYKIRRIRKRLILFFILLIISLCLYFITGTIEKKQNNVYHTPSDYSEEDFLFPTGGIITALEKKGSHENNGAVDIANIEGSDIIASMGGHISFAGENGTYGNCIIINHGNGYCTLYAHLNSIDVIIDELVSQGQVIGTLGSTGNSTGPHLHFEIRLNDQRQDLLDYFPFLKENLQVIIQP